MIECPKCSTPIPPERTRTYRTPTGRAWLLKAWCESCDLLAVLRQRSDPGERCDVTIFEGTPAVRRFVKTLRVKPEIQRKKQKGPS